MATGNGQRDGRAYWDGVYAARRSDAVSWYQPHATMSLRLIGQLVNDPAVPLIDVGGGASTLVDDLLEKGFTRLTVLDLAGTALADARARLGALAAAVQWLQADVTTAALPPGHFALWHDRAVFHFLVDPAACQAYVEQAWRSLRRGGHLIVATFAEDGPLQCSGLPVMRYSADALHAAFGERFTLLASEREDHRTPAGKRQAFTYCVMRRD